MGTEVLLMPSGKLLCLIAKATNCPNLEMYQSQRYRYVLVWDKGVLDIPIPQTLLGVQS